MHARYTTGFAQLRGNVVEIDNTTSDVGALVVETLDVGGYLQGVARLAAASETLVDDDENDDSCYGNDG